MFQTNLETQGNRDYTEPLLSSVHVHWIVSYAPVVCKVSVTMVSAATQCPPPATALIHLHAPFPLQQSDIKKNTAMT